MKIAIIANSAKCSQEEFNWTKELFEQEKHEIVGTSFADNKIVPEGFQEAADLAIVVGGDGTIISACHYFGDRQVPLLGVNVGKLGYLAHFDFEQLKTFVHDTLHQFLAGKCCLSERMLLEVTIGPRSFIAVNDLVVDIGPPFRTTEIDLRIDGHKLPLIRGDGIIIATPTGSTAYNLSAGGSIIQPEVEGIAVTPKNPHRLSFRPLVIHHKSRIKINVPNPEGVYFIIDGQENMSCTACESATIGRFHQNLKIVTRKDYWATLTSKLNWGC